MSQARVHARVISACIVALNVTITALALMYSQLTDFTLLAVGAIFQGVGVMYVTTRVLAHM